MKCINTISVSIIEIMSASEATRGGSGELQECGAGLTIYPRIRTNQ